MTYPSSDVNRANADASTDSPASFRTDVLDLIDKFNLLRNWISDFMRGLLTAGNPAVARGALVVPSTTGADASGIWGINITGNAATATIGLNALGVGQTWQDVAAARGTGTIYTNSTGKTIWVMVTVLAPANTAVSANISGVATWYEGSGANTRYVTASFAVPPGASYSVTTSGSLGFWSELR
nr:hypothetical protein [uncultured Albidiferax sp.]